VLTVFQDNISKYLKACIKLGFDEKQLFVGLDFFKQKDIKKVRTPVFWYKKLTKWHSESSREGGKRERGVEDF
jgi:hypothetical protein